MFQPWWRVWIFDQLVWRRIQNQLEKRSEDNAINREKQRRTDLNATLCIEEYIIRFDIPMYDFLAMQVS